MTTMITEKNFALEISQKMQEKTLNITSKLPFPIKKREMEGTYREQIPPILKHVLEVLGHNGTLFEKQN